MEYKVLVTDDNAINRSLIIQILRGTVGNTTYFEATNGEECLEIMEKHDIDLNILDLLMPKMDGFEVIRRMKLSEKLCDIPVIINSAVEDLPSIQKILMDGASDYFSKPLMPDEMKIFLPLKVKNALIRYEQHKNIKNINERHQQELLMASALQCSMMARYKKFSSAEMFGGYLPSNEIGGDFYDCVESRGKLWFLIADVAGHGIAAAMVSMMLKGIFGDLLPEDPDPGLLLQRLNRKLTGMLGRKNPYLLTAFAGCMDGNTLYYANAGHPYPLIYRPSEKKTEVLKQNGFLLGAFEDAEFETQETVLQKNDWFLTYTDGIFGKMYGSRTAAFECLFSKIEEEIRKCGDLPDQLIENMIHESFGDSASDDISVMIIRKL